jgi:hypothetical protein
VTVTIESVKQTSLILKLIQAL